MNDEKLAEIRNNLHKVDWIGLLNRSTCNEYFNMFSDKIKVMDKTAPLKTVRISAKHKYIKPWMSKGIEVASRKNTELYHATLKPNADSTTIAHYQEY